MSLLAAVLLVTPSRVAATRNGVGQCVTVGTPCSLAVSPDVSLCVLESHATGLCYPLVWQGIPDDNLKEAGYHYIMNLCCERALPGRATFQTQTHTGNPSYKCFGPSLCEVWCCKVELSSFSAILPFPFPEGGLLGVGVYVHLETDPVAGSFIAKLCMKSYWVELQMVGITPELVNGESLQVLQAQG